jgi:4-diphosphocytidyl-2-C-methyl-D-erythritol kinase
VVKFLSVVNPLPTVTVFSPAKINLYLAVTGRRVDGYHDLVSVVAPLTFGDQLVAEARGEGQTGRDQFVLECDDPGLAVDGSNLVLMAAAAFGRAIGWKAAVKFRLIKRIPVGAGLGGGSSNAAATLLALNQLSGAGLDRAALTTLAMQVGSDCPLFLPGGPVVMRGRGEQVEPLPAATAARWRGRRVLLFKPDFSIGTAWAYGQMAASAPAGYLPAPEAERRLAAWIAGAAGAGELLFNNLEPVVFRKFIALPALLERLRTRFDLAPRMSGSGSACFALLPDGAPMGEIIDSIREAWGPRCFVRSTAIA